ncbi:MAG: thioredoxin family protein [Peptostreptococcaceae bacterium]
MKIIKNNDEIIDLIENYKIVLIYFSGNNCGICKVIKSKVENILKQYPYIVSVEVKTEECIELIAQYNIFTIPGILVYVDKKETIREARYISIEELELKIDRYYNMIYS